MSGASWGELDLKGSLGLLALAVTLALTSPGVRVVRADEAPSQAPPSARAQAASPAGVCSATALLAPTATTARIAEEARRRLEGQITPRPDLPVALNTRGYNYTTQ